MGLIQNYFVFNNYYHILIHLQIIFLFYRCFVNGTFLLFNGNSRQLDVIKIQINTIRKNLQFPIEVKNNSKLNLLDLTISKMDKSFKQKSTSTNHLSTIRHNNRYPIISLGTKNHDS